MIWLFSFIFLIILFKNVFPNQECQYSFSETLPFSRRTYAIWPSGVSAWKSVGDKVIQRNPSFNHIRTFLAADVQIYEMFLKIQTEYWILSNIPLLPRNKIATTTSHAAFELQGSVMAGMNLSWHLEICRFPAKKIHDSFSYMKTFKDMIIWRLLRGKVKIEITYQFVILSFAKDLWSSTLCIQILHFVQNDTKLW